MTFPTARAKVVEIITAITPTSNLVFGGGFAHAPEADEGDEQTTRTFMIEADTDGEGGIPGPFTPGLSGQARFNTTLSITFFYAAVEGRRADADVDIAMDAADIAKILENPVSWGAYATTTIAHITGVTWQRTKYEGGRVEQKFTMTMHYSG